MVVIYIYIYMSFSIRLGDPLNGNIPLLVVSQLDANTYRCFKKIGVGFPPKWMIYFMENPIF